MEASGQVSTSGGRKEAVARVRMVPGTGTILVNGRPSDKYFPKGPLQTTIRQPLVVANAEGRFDVIAKVTGGGMAGQAGGGPPGVPPGPPPPPSRVRAPPPKAGV